MGDGIWRTTVVTVRTVTTLAAIGIMWWLLWSFADSACRDAWAGIRGDGEVGPRPLDRLVTDAAGCAAVLTAAVLAVLAVVAVVHELAARLAPGVVAIVPRVGPVWWRRLVLTVCGLGLVSPFAPAAAAADPASGCVVSCSSPLVGLELPDLPAAQPRPTDLVPHRHAAGGALVRDQVVVHPGDSLWLISQRLLGPDAEPSAIAEAVHRIYAVNRITIGVDPDLIQPETTLGIPQTLLDPSETPHDSRA